MDSAVGVLDVGDVLIADGVIVEVAPSIKVDDAEIVDATGHIVAPGMIDTHRHTWQTQIRGLCADWSLADYAYGVRYAISPAYSPTDIYLGNKLGALEALNAGVTTILDFSHCNNTPDHSDAAVTGLRDAGIRAIYGYGYFESNPQSPGFASHADRVKDFERIAATYFTSSGLLSLGAAIEVGFGPLDDTRAEIEAVRAHGGLTVCHTGSAWSAPAGFEVKTLAAAGLLGPDQVHVHCNTLDDDDWQALADAGAKVSISVETELNMGMGRPVFAACEKYGIKPTLSADVISLASGDMITQMRMGLGFKRWTDAEPGNLAGIDPVKVSTTTLEALEWTTANAADAIGKSRAVGSITPGKEADLILVGGPSIGQHPQNDAAGTIVFQSTPNDVRAVLVAGRFVKRDGVLLDVSLPTLLAEADESNRSILERVRASMPVFPPTPENGINPPTPENSVNESVTQMEQSKGGEVLTCDSSKRARP